MREVLLPRSVANANKVVNRVQRIYAPFVPPFAVVVHKGRRSGREYRTPVAAYRFGDRIYIGLPYGRDSDWVRNLTAAGRGGVERLGRAHRITAPRVLTADDAASAEDLPAPVRYMARYVNVLAADID
ncbi:MULTISPECIES: nitroreductase family deazaflavin-dependent oxidoreductase [Actinomadura]|uniref:Nitroreductase family deazaflavin-dependent oxidoreductase n=1 Tax=Actinomadura yumaensis TaxID=111807 RepID=A0ABW2CQS7_9ACTN|nr:nitroreductase family deazaflavin-dependent oxidoreductase [Actinomadura sp. J1-007]